MNRVKLETSASHIYKLAEILGKF